MTSVAILYRPILIPTLGAWETPLKTFPNYLYLNLALLSVFYKIEQWQFAEILITYSEFVIYDYKSYKFLFRQGN